MRMGDKRNCVAVLSFCNLDKCIWQFRQLHFTIETNVFSHLEKYADAIVDAAKQREQRQMQEQPSTRLLKQSVQHLLHQELPLVLHWIAHPCLHPQTLFQLGA